MLAAELVAQKSGKTLDFGGWNGEDPALLWAQNVRVLLQNRDVDVQAEPLPTPSHQASFISPIHNRPSAPSQPPGRVIMQETEVDSDDDVVSGYTTGGSSRSVSPTPSEILELENEPSLAAGVRKVQRPVYLMQLGEMMRGSSGMQAENPREEADTMEVALNCAAELIRRKELFGSSELGT